MRPKGGSAAKPRPAPAQHWLRSRGFHTSLDRDFTSVLRGYQGDDFFKQMRGLSHILPCYLLTLL
jgi:hypothetical protein